MFEHIEIYEPVVNTNTRCRRILDYGESIKPNASNTQSSIFTSQSQIENERRNESCNLDNSLSNNFQPICETNIVQNIPGSSQNETSSNKNVENISQHPRKRTIQELFGDIDDLLFENERRSKKSKAGTKLEQQMDMIEKILELRKQRLEDNNVIIRKKTPLSTEERSKLNLSWRVPTYPFIRITRHDDEKLYIRCHSETYEKEDTVRVVNEINFVGVMGDMFKETWQKAHEIINKGFENSTENSEESMEILELEEDHHLWVDLYRPKRYLELLSDETTNRILLKWIKLWDKVVFHRRPKIQPVVVGKQMPNKKFINALEDQLRLEEDDRPVYKVALLCGRPGLGKTTLAHVVAKQAGYNVIEINASDDRSLEVFRKSLENATQMRSVLDQQKRPNCVIFDEIDGAPSQSIEFLVKFVSGIAPKGKKKNKENISVLKRPIICICNDVYVPALRSLRQIAFIVNFPPTSSGRLSERLMEIAKRQQLKTDLCTMMALAEKSQNDVRSCLSMLHFFKGQMKPITLSDVYKSSIGQKDMQKGLFSVWNDIFSIERAKPKFSGALTVPKEDLGKTYDMSQRARMNKILTVIQSFGDYDRLAQGVFENFPEMQIKQGSLLGTCHALDWFCFNDKLSKYIMSQQNYSLNPYLPYAFVVWHFQFSSLLWPKIKYPNMGHEVRQKLANNLAAVKELQKGLQPKIKVYLNEKSLIMDILHPLYKIINPSFRPVNLHLFTQEETKMFTKVVDIMIDYNLTYVQEKNVSGIYEFKLEPDVLPVIMYPNLNTPKWRVLSYFNRQLITREVELGKIKRLQLVADGEPSKKGKEVKKNPLSTLMSPEDQSKLPNHLQRLKVKAVKKDTKVVVKDFFGRIITSPEENKSGAKGPHLENDIWYRYKEGYSNAVKIKIKMSSLL